LRDRKEMVAVVRRDHHVRGLGRLGNRQKALEVQLRHCRHCRQILKGTLVHDIHQGTMSVKEPENAIQLIGDLVETLR
jgi:hypothetical protein